MALDGRCLCGDVRYQIARVPEVMGVCHCKHCQRRSGSAFACMAGVPGPDFTLTAGEPAHYRGGRTDSGDTASSVFCPRCGSGIYTLISTQPDLLFLNVGTLHDTSWFEPRFQVWCDHKQQWVRLPDAETGSGVVGN